MSDGDTSDEFGLDPAELEIVRQRLLNPIRISVGEVAGDWERASTSGFSVVVEASAKRFHSQWAGTFDGAVKSARQINEALEFSLNNYLLTDEAAEDRFDSAAADIKDRQE